MAAKKRKTAQTEAATSGHKEPLLHVSEEDQWKIIRDSGVLNKVPATPEVAAELKANEPLLSPLTEEIFSAMTLIIPHSFLLLMMEMCVPLPLYNFLSDAFGGRPVSYITSMVGDRHTKSSSIV